MMKKHHKHKKEQPKLSSPVCYADSEEVRKEFRNEDTSKDNKREDAQKRAKDMGKSND